MTLLSTWMLIDRAGCGDVAFYVEEHSLPFAKRPIAYAVRPDGTRPGPEDVMVCCACNRTIGRRDLTFANFVPSRAN